MAPDADCSHQLDFSLQIKAEYVILKWLIRRYCSGSAAFIEPKLAEVTPLWRPGVIRVCAVVGTSSVLPESSPSSRSRAVSCRASVGQQPCSRLL